MNLPRFVLAEQHFPNRAIQNIPDHIRRELADSGISSRVPKGARVAIGVGSRGISNIATIVKSVVEFWKEKGAQPFIFPAMGSHGAATAEGQADVLAHYGIHEATMGVPGPQFARRRFSRAKRRKASKRFCDKNAYEADGIFLVGRVKWHTDFSGALESGLFKMMAIGLGKFAGAQPISHVRVQTRSRAGNPQRWERRFSRPGRCWAAWRFRRAPTTRRPGLMAIDFSKGSCAVIAREEVDCSAKSNPGWPSFPRLRSTS